MNTKLYLILFTSVLLSSLMAGTQLMSKLSESPRIWYVGPMKPPSYPDFASIQEAINNASVVPGDIIEVLKNGSSAYYEHVVVNKSLTIRNQEPDRPVIDGGGTGTVVNITASNVVFDGFDIRNGRIGLVTQGSSANNTITYNTFDSNYQYAIRISGLGDNSLRWNSVTSWFRDGYGILIESPNNILRYNRITGTALYNFTVYNFGVSGYYYQEIDPSNTVNGKPVCYWVNQSNAQIPIDAGYVGIVGSTNITVIDLNLSSNYEGLLVANSTNIKITNLRLTKNHDGVHFIDVMYSMIEDVTASNNSYRGIDLDSSHNNAIIGNVACCNMVGISSYRSNNTVVVENNVSGNVMGIQFAFSNNSEIYHNNFINNPNQAYEGYSVNNKWSNGAEGNYWYDYQGLDNGEAGRVVGDGIGDTNLPAPPNQKLDNYPLMDPWNQTRVFDVRWNLDEQYAAAFKVYTSSNSTRASFRFQLGRVDNRSYVGYVQTEPTQISFRITSGLPGYCNVTIPRYLLDYPLELLIDDGPASYSIVAVNEIYSSLYFTYDSGSYYIKIMGSRVGSIIGDVNGDGIIDIYDLIIVAMNFGKSVETP